MRFAPRKNPEHQLRGHGSSVSVAYCLGRLETFRGSNWLADLLWSSPKQVCHPLDLLRVAFNFNKSDLDHVTLLSKRFMRRRALIWHLSPMPSSFKHQLLSFGIPNAFRYHDTFARRADVGHQPPSFRRRADRSDESTWASPAVAAERLQVETRA